MAGLICFARGTVATSEEHYPDLRAKFRVVQIVLTFTVISRCCSPGVQIALKSCREYLDAGHRAWHFIESTYQVTDALYIGQLEEQLSHIRMGEEEKATDYSNWARRILATMRMAGVQYSTASYLTHIIKGLTSTYNLLKRLSLASSTRATLNEDSLTSYILHDEAMQEAKPPSEPLAQVNYVAPAGEDFQAMAAAVLANLAVVLLDSGCSHHLMGTKEVFVDLQPSGDIKHVRGFDGALQDVQGRGIVALQGEAGRQVLIPNVLYIPGVRANLLSAGQLKENGVKLQEDDDGMLLVSAAGDILGRASYTGRVLCTDLRPYSAKSTMPTTEVVALRAIVSVTKLTPDRLHARLAHVDMNTIRSLAKHEVAIGLDLKSASGADLPCVSCVGGKLARHTFPDQGSDADDVLAVVHVDLCGPFRVAAKDGSLYFLLLKDRKTRYVWVRPMKKSVLMLRFDRGGEFLGKHFTDFMNGKGIVHDLTCPYTPQQNGMTEREMRTVVESPGTTPYKLLTGKKPDLSLARVWGCMAQFLVPEKLRGGKLKPKARWGLHLGVSEESKGWELLDIADNRVVTTWEVVFYENMLLDVWKSEHGPASGRMPTIPPTNILTVTLPLLAEVGEPTAEDVEDVPSPFPSSAPRAPPLVAGLRGLTLVLASSDEGRSGASPVATAKSIDGGRRDVQQFDVRLKSTPPGEEQNGRERAATAVTPCSSSRWDISTMTLKEALASWKGKAVKAAMEEEIRNLVGMGTWELVERPPGVNIMKNRWVLTTTYHIDDTVEREKARMVVKGFTHVYGADYDEMYPPVSGYITLRIFLSIVAVLDLNLMHLDMKNAFLQSKLDRVLYMALDGVLLGAGWKKSQVDTALYFKVGDDKVTCWVLVYADDLLAASSSAAMLKELLKAAFELREISPVQKYLGLEIVHDRSVRKLWLHQQGYADMLHRRFLDEEQNRRTLKTPISVDAYATLTFDDEEAQVDRCLAYLANTRDIALEFGGGAESLKLVGYVDADDADDKQNWTSTGGYVFVFGGAAISWSSQRIKCATLSSTESEYVAATEAGKEGHRIHFLLAEFRQLDTGTPAVLRVDNKSAITVAEGMGLTGNLKHMERRQAWLQHMVKSGKFSLRYIQSVEQPADFLTKALHYPAFNRCSVAIGQVCLVDMGDGDNDVQQ
ncbi:unnamed protein product [Closterium sp. NIES-54]